MTLSLARNTTVQKFGAFLLAAMQIFFTAGCRQATGGSSGGSSSSTAAGVTGGVNMGQIAYDVLHHQYETDGKTAEATALEGRHDDFVSAVNRILPHDVSSNLGQTLTALMPLIDDGTVDAGANDIAALIQELLGEQNTLASLTQLLNGNTTNSTATRDTRATDILISRLLGYSEMDDLARAFMELVRDNDGVDVNGLPNGEANLIRELQALVSRKLIAYQPAAGSTTSPISQTLQDLEAALLSHQPLKAFTNLGDQAYAVRIDDHGNAKVTVDAATSQLPVPYIDADGDGNADVNANGKPIDAAGAEIGITPFGSDGSRDSWGRAMAPGGGLYFEYFDVKRTLLSELLLLGGEAVEKDVLGKTIVVLDGLTNRVNNTNGTVDPSDDYVTLAQDSPLLDLTHAQFELMKRTRLPDLLKGLAAVVKNDPTTFADMVDSLIVAIKISSNVQGTAIAAPVGTPITGTPITGPSFGSDLLPLLEDALKPRGQNTSAIRGLLQAFTTEQRRLKTLPVTFARMLKYHDYGTRQLADGTHKSVMQRVLDMMVAANDPSCHGPLGNMAEFYLKAMAGEQRILGIRISTNTIHRLMSVGFIRRLLCSGIKEDDVKALQDFDRTGALAAMKPIAKAFVDRGEVTLLKDIMLGLQRHYDAVLRPTEPNTVALLESGALEKLFEVLDTMTTVRVPGSNLVVADALADTLEGMLNSATPVLDRNGVAYDNLAKLMMAPMDTLDSRATSRGLKPTLDELMTDLGDILLATYMDDMGTPTDPSDDVERWKWQGLSNSLGTLLEFVADGIPDTVADRNQWATDKQAEMVDLLSGRDIVFAIDLLKTISNSPQSAVINRALSNLLTPNSNPQDDVFGAILTLLADSFAHKPNSAQPVNAQALADVLHFAGRSLDPRAHKLDDLIMLIRKFLRADEGLLLLRIARNAFDKGPNGTDASAIEVLTDVFDEIGVAGGAAPQMTVADLEQSLHDVHDFLTDAVDGLPAMLNRMRGVRLR
jgi:hypothetical protein